MAHIVSVGDMLKFQPGPLSLPPPPTDAQAALSSQLAALAAQMHEISSRLNALSLPATLPPEILLEVFLTHAARVQREHLDGVYDDHKHSRRVGSYFKWIRVAHVCRYWREVALSSAEFKAFCVFEAWSVPKGGEPLDIPTGFWRYHPHTVVYHQNMDHKCPRCTWNYTHTCGIHHITIHAKRVRHLAIIIEADDGTALLWDRLRAAAWSELESFRIGLRGDAWGYHTSGFAARLTIPDDLFASSTPRLRSLTTSHVSFSFASAMLRPSLRHLGITAHPGHEAHRDMQDLISTLKNLQSLETLAMDCLPIVPSEPFTGEAYLPRLALLRLTTEFQRAAVFLSHVRIPGTTSVVLALKPRAECLAPPPAFIEELSKIAKAAPLCTASWSISPNNAGFCRDQSSLRAWAAVRPPVDELWVSKPDTAPRLTINGHTHGLIIDILGALDLPHLTSLHLKGPMPAQEAWARAFKRAPKVTLLRVTGRVGFQLGTGLSVAMGDQAGEGRRSASCALPQLRTIQFVDVLFPPPHEGNAAYPFAGADVCFV
ncbi:hypothetical protein PYCCODRAFT_1470816 [Trametes coccinea BRFM310]|uniref:Uncharacterized protein n=1 Tax=Trametes coccinea (strain BRFM310) TaxID=1353009 RepID=A0A1Y2IC21_TRAC3|nr:hypothetical protein PYCCODRAFT_1470816 [Trametes coccinea BRFM310]